MYHAPPQKKRRFHVIYHDPVGQGVTVENEASSPVLAWFLAASLLPERPILTIVRHEDW